MGAYIVRRLLLIIPTVILVTIIVFFTIRLIPGSVLDIMIAQQSSASAMPLDTHELEHRLGLDVPIHVQYGRWLGVLPKPDEGFNGVLQGDLGRSLWKGYAVTDELAHRFPVSFELGIIAMVTAIIISIPIGIYSAVRQDTVGDYAARSFAIACIALPSFWIGTMVVVFPSIWWHWVPSMEYIPFIQNPIENLKIMIIPGVILGMVLSGTTMRMTRTMMLEVLRQDYIRTAWSKGLTERRVIFGHALRNALIPVVTIIGVQIPVCLGGSVVLEQIFSLPGIGRLTIEVLNNRDYPVLSGINLFMAFFVLVINLVVDLTYGYLDPRVEYR